MRFMMWRAMSGRPCKLDPRELMKFIQRMMPGMTQVERQHLLRDTMAAGAYTRQLFGST
jgi:hypothetical protein